MIYNNTHIYIYYINFYVCFVSPFHFSRFQVDKLLAELQGQTQKLKVNAVGLSRGGIACSYLAQVMSDIPASRGWTMSTMS